MIAPAKLQALPARVSEIRDSKRAHIRKLGINERERKRRQDDVDTLDLLYRIAFVIAKAPEEFAQWFCAQTNGGRL